MEYLNCLKEQQGGFSFDLMKRNEQLQKTMPQFTKTGTTIVGVLCKDGVVLGADTRATSGPIVEDKNCEKIDYLAPNMYCCGAGTAADTFYIKHLMSSNLELMRLQTGRESRLTTVVARLSTLLHKYQGHMGAALIIGGYDFKGPQLVMISPAGNYSYLPFCTMGSGSLAAVAILETKYKDDLTIEEGKALVLEAVEAGILHDLGSGSNVDLCVLTKGKTDYLRNFRTDNKKEFERKFPYKFPLGNTPFLREMSFTLEKVELSKEEKMEILS